MNMLGIIEENEYDTEYNKSYKIAVNRYRSINCDNVDRANNEH